MTAMFGAERRVAILERLTWRNRIVGVLRFAVPGLGVAAFAALVVQIMIANTLQSYGLAGIRIDRGNLVVEVPQYSGISSDGSRYLVRAKEARSALGNTQIIDMVEATIDMLSPGEPGFHATADKATADTGRQRVTIPGLTVFHGDDGMRGTLQSTRLDTATGDIVADGEVDIVFSDGSTLKGANMVRDAKQKTWTFTAATMIVPDLPKSSFPPIPFVSGLWVVR